MSREDRPDTFEVSLFAAGEFGRPFWKVRRFIVWGANAVALGLLTLAARLYHPLHPYRIYVEGAVVVHRGIAAEAAGIPTRPGVPHRRRKTRLAVVLVAYLLVADVVATVPGGFGLLETKVSPLHALGFTDEAQGGIGKVHLLQPIGEKLRLRAR
jgi:hypothetical protein